MRSATTSKQKAKGNLANRSRSSSTDRVLNLVSVYRENHTNPEYTQSPLFRNPRLNKSIFLKHTLRKHERDQLRDYRMSVTKLIMPVDTSDLSLGGFSCFLNEPEIERTICSAFGGDITSEDFRRDIQILKILDSLPTFDPFLLRERLRREGTSVAKCYFDLTEADANRMREYVQGEIQKIVRLALTGEAKLMDQSSTITHKLMTDETATSLEPLRQVLQMSGDEWSEGVFAWKGFLYYSWNIDSTAKLMPQLQRQLLAARITGATRHELRDIDIIRRRISRCLAYLHQVALDGVAHYRSAYKDLIDGKPSSFQEFLKNAAASFIEVGEAFGMIMHMRSFYNFRFSEPGHPLTVDEALEIFRDFDTQFAGIYERIE